MDTRLDHQKVKELSSHKVEVAEIKRRAHHWRLIDCSAQALEQMRHVLIDEMQEVEKKLQQANHSFLAYIEDGEPLSTEQALQSIDRLSGEWEALNERLQDIDEALLERHLRTRLIAKLGSARRLATLEALVFASIVIVVILTIIEIVAEPYLGTSSPFFVWIATVDLGISLFLLSDFFLRFSLTEDRGWYLRRYWIDFVSAIPFYIFFRFALVSIARLARLLRLLRIGRAIRALLFAFRGLEKISQTFQMTLLKRSIITVVALLIFGALSIKAFEGGQSVSVQDINESLWWSFTTVVTGGFADLYNPTTTLGRIVTVGLVLLGLAITSIFTASLTSVLVGDESSRLERAQQDLDRHLEVIDQKVDLLSGETNEGLLALETVAQALSNQRTRAEVADILVETLVRDFEALQASVYLWEGTTAVLNRRAQTGSVNLSPPPEIKLGDGLAGRVAATLLQQEDAAAGDLEPETEPNIRVRGITMVCPLVAGRQLVGILHVVLPENLGRYYLYNRVPMTLAHHAAMAFLICDDKLAREIEEEE